jgi:hypothetical protein
MTYEQIDRLLTAGFTPDQIMVLSSAPADSAVPPPPAETPAPDPESAPDPAPAVTPSPAPESAPEPGILEEIKTGFEDLKKTIQANNIKTMSVNTLQGSQESAETVLAGIIRPPFEDKNNIGGATK